MSWLKIFYQHQLVPSNFPCFLLIYSIFYHANFVPLWDNCPQSVKSFPWKKALGNFVQLVLDLTLAVVKYLCVPLLAVSSLSEMSYCAHERKLFLVPVPLVIGITVAGVLKETALDLSPRLKVNFLALINYIDYLRH